MGASRVFVKRNQTTTHSTLENRLVLVRSLIKTNQKTMVVRPKQTRKLLPDKSYAYERVFEESSADDLHVAASTFREVYTSEIEERFFANAKICDTDLVALLLNWPVDYKKVLV